MYNFIFIFGASHKLVLAYLMTKINISKEMNKTHKQIDIVYVWFVDMKFM